MELYEKIKELRKNNNETQEQLAESIGIGISTLKTYESKKGTRKPDIETLKKIKEHYDVTYEYLFDDECENSSIQTMKIGEELHLSDESISKIKELSKIKYFNENISSKQKKLINEFNKNMTFNKLEILNNSNANNMFNIFIEDFKDLSNYIRKLSELYNLIELLKNIELFKSICYISKVIEKLVKNKNETDIDNLIKYYNEKLDIIQLLSLSTIHSYSINLNIKENYKKIKMKILKYNFNQIQDDLSDLKSEILQIIHFLNNDISRCKYELSELINQYYNDLIEIAKDKIYVNNKFKDKYVRNLLEENQKLLDDVNNVN